jgi:hypothetical protein
MPREYNAASPVRLPDPSGTALDAAIENISNRVTMAAAIQNAPAQVTFVGGLEGGIVLALSDPDLAEAILRHIDANKAEADARKGNGPEMTQMNATYRQQVMQEIIDAARGVNVALPKTTWQN